MEARIFFKLVKKRKGAILLIILLFLLVAAAVSFGQPLKYRARSRLLIIQEGTFSDPYTVAKSNQYLSSLLSEATYSGSFFELLTASGYNVDWSYFGNDYKTQLKKWKQTIVAKNVNDTGVMEIDVYHPDAYQVRQIALAVANALVSQNKDYQGLGDIKIKVIDQPVVSAWPVKPNLPLNFGAAGLIGLITGLIYVYYFPLSLKDKRRLKIGGTGGQRPPEIVRPEEKKEEAGKSREKEQSHFYGDFKNIIRG